MAVRGEGSGCQRGGEWLSEGRGVAVRGEGSGCQRGREWLSEGRGVVRGVAARDMGGVGVLRK